MSESYVKHSIATNLLWPVGRLRSTCLVLLLVAWAAACAPVPPAPPLRTPKAVPDGALVVKNGQVIDGTGAAPIRDGIVVILKDRILAVGQAADWAVPPETHVVDAQGGTVLPGIFNAHVHETGSPIVRQFYFLARGVTAVCDMAVPLPLVADYGRDAVLPRAAHGFRTGPIINAPEGYPGEGNNLLYPVANPDEARKAVDDVAGRGADYIKVALEPGGSRVPWPSPPQIPPIPTLDLPMLQAIVAEAHKHGKLVRVHIGTAAVLDVALDAGVDALEHIPLPRLDQVDFADAVQGRGYARLAPEYEAQLARMVKQKVIMTPTLTQIISWCQGYADTPERKALCAYNALAPVHRFHEMGGTLGLGDDSTYGSRTWMPLEEMHWLSKAGLTPMEIIVAGTRNSARVCGHGDELGTLEAGKQADLIVVSGDPLVNIDVLGNVSTVILGGKVVR